MTTAHSRTLPVLVALVALWGGTGSRIATEQPTNDPLTLNGGFETGNLGDWTSRRSVVMRAHRGVTARSGTMMAVLSPQGDASAQLTQRWALEPFTSLTISFDYNLWALDESRRADEGEDTLAVSLGEVTLLRETLDDEWDGGLLGWGSGTPTRLGWRTFTETYTDPAALPSGTTRLSFVVNNTSSSQSRGDSGQLFTAFIDNVTVDVTRPGARAGLE